MGTIMATNPGAGHPGLPELRFEAGRLGALADAALAFARRGERGRALVYAEIRFVEQEQERIATRNRGVEELSRSRTLGAGVRVLAGGGWGFASTAVLTEGSLAETVDRALVIALAAGSLATAPILFPPRDAEIGSYETPLIDDPFAVPLARKLADLLAPHDVLLASPRVRTAESWMDWSRVQKLLVSTEGTRVVQRIVTGGAGMSVVAVDDGGLVQRRTYPGFRGSELAQGGYELIGALDLLGHAAEVREEAIALLAAPPCPAGVRTVILGSNQLALQVHESCGHPTELDRALGSEITLAGGSFLQPGMLDRFRYGSPIVSLTADAITPGGLGTFGWDDEGIPAGSAHLVRDGIFVNYLSSRASAAALGRPSTGAMRAEHHARTPVVRMLNVSLVPREGTLDALVADTEDGILLDIDKSWSIDDLRLGFQFSCELAWEIKHGKRVRLLRDAIYQGTTPSFWGSCDAICGPEEAKLWGIATCGKGEPGQSMSVGHGAPPARFRGVTVGHT